MQSGRIHILSTRPLAPSLVEKAAQKAVVLDCIAFIEIRPIEDRALRERILALSIQPVNAVFTSTNAVSLVSASLAGIKPSWTIYCTREGTQQSVAAYFGNESIQAVADDAATLADAILARGDIASVIFFCGDRRRDILPEKLSRGGIQVEDLIVYQTIETGHRIQGPYEGIIFFSPSAVHSFFAANRLDRQTVVFAIGKTTAESVKIYAPNKLISAATASGDQLVGEAIDYFYDNPISH